MKLIKHVLPFSLLILGALCVSAQTSFPYAIPNPASLQVCGGGAPVLALNCNGIQVVTPGTDSVQGTAWIEDNWDPNAINPSRWILFGGGLAGYNSGNPNNAGDLLTQSGCQTWTVNPPGVPAGMYCTFAFAYFTTPQYGINLITMHFNYYYSSAKPASVHRVITAGGITFNVGKAPVQTDPVPATCGALDRQHCAEVDSPIAPTPTCIPDSTGKCPKSDN